MNTITIENLSKSFGGLKAVDNVTLSIPGGKVYALLGPNGAGKTTLIRCLLALAHPDTGKLTFGGKPLTEGIIRHSFGYLPECFLPPPRLTCFEFLRLFYPSSGIREKLDEVGLLAYESCQTGKLSKGMLQRLGLTLMLGDTTEAVLLDEPFLGLDLLGQNALLNIISRIKQQQKTVIISSHTLRHLEGICENVAILDRGALILQMELTELLKTYQVSDLSGAFLKAVNSWRTRRL